MVMGSSSASAEVAKTPPAEKWKLGGRRFTISWPLGDAHPKFKWFRKSPGDHPNGDSLPMRPMHYLGYYLLNYTGSMGLWCFTEFTSAD
jgi:hypothetical protein